MNRNSKQRLLAPITIFILLLVTPIFVSARGFATSPGSWSPGFRAVPIQVVTALNALNMKMPSLGFLSVLSPTNEAHRSLVGAIGLSAQLQEEMIRAVKAGDGKALATLAPSIVTAYHSSNAKAVIGAAVTARAARIRESHEAGYDNSDVLSEASIEMAPFSSLPMVGHEVRAVEAIASSLRRKVAAAIAEARRSAELLVPRRDSCW